MNIKTLNVSLLSFSILTALFPLNAMATKLTIEQRLELLENELSKNKQELKATQNELGVYKSRLSGNDSNLLIVFYVQIMPDDLVMQLHRF